ncbi:MAG: hypothetical protein AABX05_03985 [Nanoarchaeota archaeon]
MVIHLNKTLQDALGSIQFLEGHTFPVHEMEQIRTIMVSDEILERYGSAKWAIIDMLNERYGIILFNKFDLHNWIDKNTDDEVAYFLNEAGSNSLNYSQFKAPAKFHLWLGKKGFVIGIEQKGKGFNAGQINEMKIKENLGGAFSFYRECKNNVFFDDPENARIVYFELIF